nr:uncharacterized protein LOC123766101 isoform X4 [Procambarus clarkii]
MAMFTAILGALFLFVVNVSAQYRPVQIPNLSVPERSTLGNNIHDARFPNPLVGPHNLPTNGLGSLGKTGHLGQDVAISQSPPIILTGPSGPVFPQDISNGHVFGPVFGQGVGSGQASGAVFGQGVGSSQASRAVFGQGVGSGQASGVVFGQGVGSGQASGAVFGQGVGSGQFSQVTVPRVTSGSGVNIIRTIGTPQVRRVDALLTPTVTQVITIDRCVTVTDQAFNSVAVTLTSFNVQTVTVGTRLVLQTPVDDRVALQTSVFVRPGTVTLTEVKSDFRIVTETSLTHVTLAHTSYVISQYTFTTTATQVISYTATLVRTNISTQRATITNYRTVTDTVFVNSGYGYRAR